MTGSGARALDEVACAIAFGDGRSAGLSGPIRDSPAAETQFRDAAAPSLCWRMWCALRCASCARRHVRVPHGVCRRAVHTAFGIARSGGGGWRGGHHSVCDNRQPRSSGLLLMEKNRPPPPPRSRSDPQRVRMCSGERPIGAAKGKQSDTEALCQTPPPGGGGGAEATKKVLKSTSNSRPLFPFLPQEHFSDVGGEGVGRGCPGPHTTPLPPRGGPQAMAWEVGRSASSPPGGGGGALPCRRVPPVLHRSVARPPTSSCLIFCDRTAPLALQATDEPIVFLRFCAGRRLCAPAIAQHSLGGGASLPQRSWRCIMHRAQGGVPKEPNFFFA